MVWRLEVITFTNLVQFKSKITANPHGRVGVEREVIKLARHTSNKNLFQKHACVPSASFSLLRRPQNNSDAQDGDRSELFQAEIRKLSSSSKDSLFRSQAEVQEAAQS